jgi:hypothetical protein
MDPEIEELPTDYLRGLDFTVKKTTKGGYADYSTSNWARKESSLTEAEQAAIEAHGLFNLADFLPKKPSESELRVIKEMFEASVDGRPYDADKWGAYYRPYGVDAPAGNSNTATTESVPPKVVDYQPSHGGHAQVPSDDTPPFEVDEPIKVPEQSTSSDKAQDILAMIRARQTK